MDEEPDPNPFIIPMAFNDTGAHHKPEGMVKIEGRRSRSSPGEGTLMASPSSTSVPGVTPGGLLLAPVEARNAERREEPRTHQFSWIYGVLLPLAVIGMSAGIVGSLLHESPDQKWWFLASALLMTPLPLARRDELLSSLQVVSIGGAVVGVLPWSGWIAGAVPSVLAMGAVTHLWRRGAIPDRANWFGVAGVIALAMGYVTRHPIVYLSGGVLLTIYTGLAIRKGCRIAVLWCVLNAVFVVTSGVAVAQLLR